MISSDSFVSASVKLAYSYVRFSTPEQAKGDSLRRQLKLSSDYAAKHGLILDTRLKLRDLGVSGFKGKNIVKGALGAFLKGVKSGVVKRGSLLLVESLDRISRAEISEQVTLFMELINAGVEIVTLADEMRYSKKSINENMGGLMYSIMLMSRGHEESAMKSRRIVAAWAAKRESGKPLTARCPAWLSLKVSRDGYERNDGRCVLLKRIFTMAESGLGKDLIARTLNKERQKVWGRGNGWHASYVQKILTNRSVLGEYQHHKMENGRRVPIGLPISDYFPRVISEATFQAVRARSVANGRVKGRRSISVANLFTGLLKCGYAGTPMIYSNKGKWQYLVSDTARRGVGGYYASWPYADFEISFLTFLSELKFEELFDTDWQERQRVGEVAIAEIRGELELVRKNIGLLTESILGSDKSPKAVVARIGEFENLESDLVERLKQAERTHGDLINASRASEEQQQELKSLMAKREDRDVRLRLQRHIREHVQKIELFGLGSPLARTTVEDEIFWNPTGDPFDATEEERIRRFRNTGLIKGRGAKAKEELVYLESQLRQIPSGTKRSRYFKVSFVAGGVKMVMPDHDDPSQIVKMVRAERTPAGEPKMMVMTPNFTDEWEGIWRM